MRSLSKFIIFCTLFSMLSSSVLARVEGLPERYPHLRREKGIDFFGVYWREAKPNDYVYLIPAHFGATVFVLIGNVVGTPAKAVYNLCTLNFRGDDYLPPIRFSTKYFAPVGAYLLGSPFWALEKVFYEIPADMISGDSDGYEFAEEDDDYRY